MRKKITIGLCLAFCLFGSACSFESTDNVVKNTPKPRTQATTSIDAANEQRKNQIVTDSTEIDAMATTIVEKLTLEQKVGQLFIANLEQLDQSEGEFAQQREYNTKMGETLRDYHIGGVILFSRNIESINQTTGLISSLQSNADIPLFVSVDEEGGDVARVGNNSNMRTTTFPPMEEVGKTKDESYVYQMGATIGRDIKSLGFNVDFAPVAELCRQLEVPYHRISVPVYQIVFEERKEKNPCSLCAKLRRGSLNTALVERDIRKIALGHHRDDAIETLLMDLLFEGRIGCFQPVTYLDRTGVTQIRPLLYCDEAEIRRAAAREGLPVVKNACPADGNSRRQEVKERIAALEKEYPDIRSKLFGAIQRYPLYGWDLTKRQQ